VGGGWLLPSVLPPQEQKKEGDRAEEGATPLPPEDKTLSDVFFLVRGVMIYFPFPLEEGQ